MDRRDFLLSIGIVLVSASAYSFGESLKSLIEAKSENVALLYGTRYGATKDTAMWIARGIGKNVDVLNIEEIDLDKTVHHYDRFIIGSGIWIDGPHTRLMELLSNYSEVIQPKIIASFIVCGTTGEDEAGKARIRGYFEHFHKPLTVKPTVNKQFGGRMTIEKLSDKDRKLLDHFYTKILKKKFENWDRTNPELAEKFGTDLYAVAAI